MYTNLLKASKGAKKLPSTTYICLEITFFWKLKERPYDHVMYVYLPFCAFVGTNDVYLICRNMQSTQLRARIFADNTFWIA